MKITDVRLDSGQARAALEKYIFGGPYGGFRVPRGIDPKFVAQFLAEKLDAEADAGDLAKALEVMQFYEAAGALPAVRRLDAPAGRDFESLARQLMVVQILGELGTPEDTARARTRLGGELVQHPSVVEAAAYFCDAYLSLAPGIGIDAYEARLRALEKSLAEKQNESEEAMNAYDKVVSLLANDVPRARAQMACKAKVLDLPPEPRRAELIKTYLGRGAANSAYFQVWSGRLLRRMTADGEGAAILQAFSQEVDSADLEAIGAERSVDVVVLRAARAVTYLGGRLSDGQRARVAKAGTGTMDFLWDE